MNNASMNIRVHVFARKRFSFLFDSYLGVGLLAHVIGLLYVQSLEELPGCFKVAAPFYIPTNNEEGPDFSTPSPSVLLSAY